MKHVEVDESVVEFILTDWKFVPPQPQTKRAK